MLSAPHLKLSEKMRHNCKQGNGSEHFIKEVTRNHAKKAVTAGGTVQPCSNPFQTPLLPFRHNIRFTASWVRGSWVVLGKLWVTMEKIREHN